MDRNAAVIERVEISPDLIVLRVKPDGSVPRFEPGQFAVLALPGSAPRAEMSGPEEGVGDPSKWIRRAYSISSSSRQGEYLEFFLKLVRSGELTPRLFALRPGDRLWLGPRASGQFTISEVPADRNLVLVGTGTGLAPYISMIRSAHRCGVGPVFTVVHGARNSWDLGYRGELEALNHGCGNFVYVPTVTRPEPRENWRGHVGRVGAVFEDGTVRADPARDDVFLCGSPEMAEELRAWFEARGFRLKTPSTQGNLHVERY
ncbi:MAG: ferredoxin--NADP reductase [Planctomycetes bacterium]|nr:ferredoxin--NADP reductase [Planctomycetota bacterium]